MAMQASENMKGDRPCVVGTYLNKNFFQIYLKVVLANLKPKIGESKKKLAIKLNFSIFDFIIFFAFRMFSSFLNAGHVFSFCGIKTTKTIALVIKKAIFAFLRI
jgi:hypothetical protein